MSIMHYESLSNDKKSTIDMSDVAFQYSPTSQLAELNRTRKILVLLTGIEFVLSLVSVIVVIYAYAFGYRLGFEPYDPIVRFLPFLSCMCFFIGLFAADRYHIKGLRIFSNLVMLDLILTYLTLTTFIIIPICLKQYTISTVSVLVVAMSYQMAYCTIAFIPGYTIHVANKLSKLLIDNTFLTIQNN